jgi:tripartite-type tricarboxylate transporter receptor subunit TctC
MISQQSIGLFAPAGTPKAIKERIARATRTALAERAYQQMLIESGSSPTRIQRLRGFDVS